MNSLHKKIKDIRSQEQLSGFVQALAAEYDSNPSWWENKDLPTFLKALSAWIDSMDGYYKNNSLPYEHYHTIPSTMGQNS